MSSKQLLLRQAPKLLVVCCELLDSMPSVYNHRKAEPQPALYLLPDGSLELGCDVTEHGRHAKGVTGCFVTRRHGLMIPAPPHRAGPHLPDFSPQRGVRICYLRASLCTSLHVETAAQAGRSRTVSAQTANLFPIGIRSIIGPLAKVVQSEIDAALVSGLLVATAALDAFRLHRSPRT